MSVSRRGERPSLELKKSAVASSSEILPWLVLGSESQCATAAARGYHTISVRNGKACPESCVHVPFLDEKTFEGSTEDLDKFADALRASWGAGQKTFIHCYFGIERAPLALAYAIKRDVTPNVPFVDVYAFVRRMRAVALDRSAWLAPALARSLGL